MFRKHLFVISIIWISLGAVSRVHGTDAVPVLIWGGSSSSTLNLSPVNPLVKTPRSELRQILTDNLGKSLPPVLVLVKDSLCVEDITQHKEALQLATGSSSFMYLPAVETPLPVFEDLPFYNRTYDDDVVTVSNSQLVIAMITDLNAASDIYKSVKDSRPNLIAALTGKSCSYSRSDRIRRDAQVDDATELIVKTGRIFLYASKKPYLKLSDAESDFQQLSGGSAIDLEPLGVKLSFTITHETLNKIDLKFQFTENTAGYYMLKVQYSTNKDGNETVLEPDYDVVFARNFSYHCSPSIIFRKKSISLEMMNFQVQIDAPRTSDGVQYFSDAYDCVGFTSIPIWSGLFVTAILGLIMIWALTMIMDIRTMDRFDDPKGKTIAISAQE